METNPKKGSLLNKFNAKFQDAIQSNRGEDTISVAPSAQEASADVAGDTLAIHKAKSMQVQRMIVPEDVVIEGKLTSNSETEIWGKNDGDVTVNGRLLLARGADITGNVRATNGKIQGNILGKIDCSDQLDVGETGRLHSDVTVGNRVALAGKVTGNITCGGVIELLSTAEVTGNIRARSLVIEEGAVLNGSCTMARQEQRIAK